VYGNRFYDQLSTGMSHTCGVTRAGRGFCWGDNSFGQLGNGTLAASRRPTAVGGDLSLVQVSGQYDISCGVTTDHRAYCWGANGTGQLGDGTQTQRLLPVPVAAPM
jgi:alpha-tubulin suppressor-like RCC1 family protein